MTNEWESLGFIWIGFWCIVPGQVQLSTASSHTMDVDGLEMPLVQETMMHFLWCMFDCTDTIWWMYHVYHVSFYSCLFSSIRGWCLSMIEILWILPNCSIYMTIWLCWILPMCLECQIRLIQKMHIFMYVLCHSYFFVEPYRKSSESLISLILFFLFAHSGIYVIVF